MKSEDECRCLSIAAEKFPQQELKEAAGLQPQSVSKETTAAWLTLFISQPRTTTNGTVLAKFIKESSDSSADMPRDPVMLTDSINHYKMLEDLTQSLNLAHVVSP